MSAPPASPSASSPSTRPLQQLRTRLLRGGLMALAVSVGIALLLTALDGRGFLIKLAYSLSIGTVCWLLIDALRGVLVFAIDSGRQRRGLPPVPGGTRLGWLSLLPLTVIAAIVGPMLGLTIGDAITGQTSPSFTLSLADWRRGDLRMTLVLTVLGTALAVLVGSLAETLLRTRLQAQVAQREAAEHRLKLLEAQLEPHMLFNTLANLRILIGTDPARAQQMLDHLNAYLRATLGGSRVTAHPLADEFDRLADYLALMTVRMGGRLSVTLDLPEALRDIPVPPLLLQPLVENAIRHGLEPKVGAGRLAVRAALDDARRLVLTVRDTGVGLAPQAATRGTRFGTEQVRARLATLYGEAARFTLADAGDDDGGCLATVILPVPGAAR